MASIAKSTGASAPIQDPVQAVQEVLGNHPEDILGFLYDALNVLSGTAQILRRVTEDSLLGGDDYFEIRSLLYIAHQSTYDCGERAHFAYCDMQKAFEASPKTQNKEES